MLLLLAQLACTGDVGETFEYPDKVAGTLQAGAAEGAIDVPMGAPMGGFSARCSLLGSSGKQDDRKSNYALSFSRSVGAQTLPQVKAIWLDNGDDHLVLLKFDAIYSYDGLVSRVTQELEEATGEELTGKVMISASHTHHMPANYSDQVHFYLGGDKYNREMFERYVDAFTTTALEAWSVREPAAVGTSWLKDWDPDDLVYRDRREDNDALQVWEDHVPGRLKDPYAHILRVDDLDGNPIAAAFTFGIHGTLMGEDNPLFTTDSTGGFERVMQDQFDEPVVVMHLQGAGGDASPAGHDREFARAESIGHRALPLLWDGYLETPTGTNAVEMEVASRHIPQQHWDIEVTREGTVDWRYAELTNNPKPDEKTYDSNGDILSPIDEFNAPYGAAFCGSDAPLIPAGNIGSEIFPYSACMDVELMAGVIAGVFQMDVNEFPLPMPESMKAGTSVATFGPLPVRMPDGTVQEMETLVGFFPAEPTQMFAEQWRRRAEAELGYEMAWLVGYSQDHEGYFLIPEDWLLGGYEPNINVWGPLQGEHVMEGTLALARDVAATPEREDADPLGWWAPTEYEDKPLPELAPDPTPSAGTPLTEAPEYLWLPEGFELDLTPPTICRRVECIVQLAWEGGDPGVDMPNVTLEREVDGEWETALTASGRPISGTYTDILFATTPDPLYPADAVQTHRWWAAWQGVGHVQDLLGMPTGTYRLAVAGKSYTGGDTWPWDTSDYSLSSDPFELEPARFAMEEGDGGLWTWIEAPANGWRYLGANGESQVGVPPGGTLTVDLLRGSEVESIEVEPEISSGRAFLGVDLSDVDAVTVTDQYGNTGTLGDL